jgi:hypothetical protein
MDNLFDVMADITNPQPNRPRLVKPGKYSMQLDIDGVLVDVTYDVEGWNTPATENDPAEAEYVEVRTAKVNGVCVMGWADRLGIEAEVYAAVIS